MIKAKYKKRGRPTKKNQKALLWMNAFFKANEKKMEKCAMDMFQHAIIYGSADEHALRHYMKKHGLFSPDETTKGKE